MFAIVSTNKDVNWAPGKIHSWNGEQVEQGLDGHGCAGIGVVWSKKEGWEKIL